MNNKLLIFLVLLGVVVWYLTSFLDNASNKVYFITFLALLWYAEQTRIIANETTTQTELSLRPVPVLYVRNVQDLYEKYPTKEAGELKDIIKKRYGIPGETGKTDNSTYYLSIMNTGQGTAFNVRVILEEKSGLSKPVFIPPGEEKPIKMFDPTKEKDHCRTGINDLTAASIEISAYSVDERRVDRKDPYKFRYKIVDVFNQDIEFLG